MKLAILFAAVMTPLISFSQMDDLSYNLGIVLSKSVQSQGLPVTDMDAFMKGFQAAQTNVITPEDVQNANLAIQQHMATAKAKESDAVKAQGEAFLAENAKREGVVTTESGLQYEIINPGIGPNPSATSTVKVHYHGTNIDGSVFDSSVDRGQPIEFPLSNVIPGWTEGVQLMQPGAKYKFYIPADLAYGDNSPSPSIKAGATLIFEVELLEIK